MIAAGQSIGNYRILGKIGTGGMGAVYVAEHPLIGKKVALKVIHRELASNKEVVQRFFQEAKAVNKIGNEHIVEIHDFGVTPEGDHFYIMEYLEGHTLSHVLGTHRVLDVMRALHVGAQVASALAAAHACGVIHRDLKPDNVMLTTRLGDPDFVKLLDFGLAKMFTGGTSAVKTAAGILLGTPQYMSPEACESKPSIDHRTDIYALGVLLFQMMTGSLPFDGETMGEVLVKQVTQLPPPPRGLNPQIPPSVEQILLRCLMKQPDARFPTMLALREALLDPEKYLANRPPIAPARSIRPGEAPVDAKTMIAIANEHERNKRGSLPLPAPAVTAPGQNTAATLIGGDLETARTSVQMKAVSPPAAMRGPDMAAPVAPKTHTMRIATPLGYSSRPPRKLWPIVLVLGLILGLGGGAFAVAWFGKDKNVAQAATDAGNREPGTGNRDQGTRTVEPVNKPVVTPVGSGTGTGTGSAEVAMANVEIDSDPAGAEVYADKKLVGKTPAKLSLPISDLPVTFELKLAGYKKVTKQVVVSGNRIVEVPLERTAAVVAPQTQTTHHRGSNHGAGSSDTGLMSPDDL